MKFIIRFTFYNTIRREGDTVSTLAWTEGCNKCDSVSYYNAFVRDGDVAFGRRMFKWRG